MAQSHVPGSVGALVGCKVGAAVGEHSHTLLKVGAGSTLPNDDASHVMVPETGVSTVQVEPVPNRTKPLQVHPSCSNAHCVQVAVDFEIKRAKENK